MADDYYSILGVQRDATTQEIKRAFRQIARECHPDVSGGDAAAEERFKSARKAYETLMDPVARARYDRRGQRRAGGGAPPPGGSFFDAFWRATGQREEEQRGRAPQPSYAQGDAGGAPRGSKKTGKHDPGNSVTLDDLFNDFGDFGFGRGKGGAKPSSAPPPRLAPEPGGDVQIDLDVPANTARDGGSVTAVYYRMQRADSWRPGAPDPGLVRVQDIADVRVIPGTTEGAVLRERGLGNAGPHGGPYGDLVVRVKVSGRPSTPQPEADAPPPAEDRHASVESDDGEVRLDISVVEALLGGRVTLRTPQGSVKLTIPAGTSGGTRMRLKGRGAPDAEGRPTDLYVVTRVVVPKQLDDESRRLIEDFARLNP